MQSSISVCTIPYYEHPYISTSRSIYLQVNFQRERERERERGGGRYRRLRYDKIENTDLFIIKNKQEIYASVTDMQLPHCTHTTASSLLHSLSHLMSSSAAASEAFLFFVSLFLKTAIQFDFSLLCSTVYFNSRSKCILLYTIVYFIDNFSKRYERRTILPTHRNEKETKQHRL